MNIEPLDPVGVRIEDVALRDPSPALVQELRALLAERGVLIAPGQHLDDDGFVAFLKAFGDLAFTTGETHAPGFPDLNVVSNVGRTTPPKSSFHVDTSYVAHPPAYTALRTVTLPSDGGETLFSNQYRAYDTLPGDLRDHLEGRTIHHVVTGLDDLPEDEETEADHPVFRPHPLTGRTALYLTTPKRCTAISGLSEDEARDTIERLFDHSTREDNVMRHTWQPGDVVMWDNGCVLHRADHSAVAGDRVLHRGMVASYG